MEDVAADRDREPLDAAEVAADRQRVEQRLGRVLVGAVAGVDHRAVDLAREQRHGAGGMMAHHQNVGAHGVERHRRVDQRLALFDAGRPDRHVHHVRAEPLARQFERRLGAGRGLEEQVDLGAPAQGRALLFDLARNGDRLVGEIEQRLDLQAVEVFDAEQVALGEDGRRGGHGGRELWAQRPSLASVRF